MQIAVSGGCKIHQECNKGFKIDFNNPMGCKVKNKLEGAVYGGMLYQAMM